MPNITASVQMSKTQPTSNFFGVSQVLRFWDLETFWSTSWTSCPFSASIAVDTSSESSAQIWGAKVGGQAYLNRRR